MEIMPDFYENDFYKNLKFSSLEPSASAEGRRFLDLQLWLRPKVKMTFFPTSDKNRHKSVKNGPSRQFWKKAIFVLKS